MLMLRKFCILEYKTLELEIKSKKELRKESDK